MYVRQRHVESNVSTRDGVARVTIILQVRILVKVPSKSTQGK